MDDERGETIDVTGLSDTDYLEIRGFTSVDGIFIANRRERDDFRGRVEIRGIARDIDADAKSLKVPGISVTV